PQNVLLCARGGVLDVAKVVDFGLVKELDRGVEASLTSGELIIGTPLYMSPEAIVRPSELDARGDLYALGAVGYYLLTGSPPFRASSIVEICGMQLHAEPDKPSTRLGRPILPALEALILRCLAKRAADRPATAQALGRELAALAVEPWSELQSEAWWAEHEQAIAAFRRQRSAEPETDSAVLMATVAVDLRERNEEVVPWHSGAARVVEPLDP
ncbi:MAG: serine/threonine kinase, partial [Myxococcaceae bacterium]|nr:serine/threonine kinase [Myxococcaceae bacterium]